MSDAIEEQDSVDEVLALLARVELLKEYRKQVVDIRVSMIEELIGCDEAITNLAMFGEVSEESIQELDDGLDHLMESLNLLPAART